MKLRAVHTFEASAHGRITRSLLELGTKRASSPWQMTLQSKSFHNRSSHLQTGPCLDATPKHQSSHERTSCNCPRHVQISDAVITNCRWKRQRPTEGSGDLRRPLVPSGNPPGCRTTSWRTRRGSERGFCPRRCCHSMKSERREPKRARQSELPAVRSPASVLTTTSRHGGGLRRGHSFRTTEPRIRGSQLARRARESLIFAATNRLVERSRLRRLGGGH